MGLLDNYSGVGKSERPEWKHQDAISNFIINTRSELRGNHDLNVLSEATVTDDWDDLAPDIVAFDENNNPRLIIEITTRRQFFQIMNKFNALISRFPNAENWIYEYENKELFLFDPKNEIWHSSAEEALYSQFLSAEMIEYLEF